MIAPRMVRSKDGMLERLGSGLVAVAFQLALAALLVLSVEAVRHAAPERETILTLPPLARPALPPPMVIDARGRRRVAPAPPPVPQNAAPAAPAPAMPPAAIVPPAVRPAERAIPAPHPDANEIPLNPQSHVKDEAHWQAEMERKNNPPDLGVAVGPGIGFVIRDPLCKLAGLILGGGLKCGAPTANHYSTDAEFQKALAAAQARTRSLYGKPVLASDAKTGGGDAQGHGSGDGGAAAGGAGGGTGPHNSTSSR